MTAKLKELLIVGGLVALVAGYFIWRQAERHAGALAVITHQADSTHVADSVASLNTLRIAQEAQTHAEAAKSAALKQIAHQRADSARQDSLVRVSANERERAEQLLRDSLATTTELRAELGRSVAQSRRDSADSKQRIDALTRTQVLLLGAIQADSASHATELRALDAMRARAEASEKLTALVKQAEPSFLSKHLSLTVGYGAVSDNGVHTGPAVVMGWKVWP